MAYSNKVIDHYENPRNVGSLPKDDVNVGTGLVGAPECGDVMKLQVKVNPTTGVIDDAKFKTFGCGSAIASSSLATEWVKGMTVDQAMEIGMRSRQAKPIETSPCTAQSTSRPEAAWPGLAPAPIRPCSTMANELP